MGDRASRGGGGEGGGGEEEGSADTAADGGMRELEGCAGGGVMNETRRLETKSRPPETVHFIDWPTAPPPLP